MSPSRLRRLQADHAAVVRLCEGNPRVKLLETEGTPPERYRFELEVNGMVAEGSDDLHPSKVHRVEVFLPEDYPRRAPFCRMLTPVFHPNIDPTKICIGDHWSAGESLPALVVRVAEMLCFQSYNVKSPLNAKAAAWAEENAASLPLEKVDLGLGL